MKRIITLFFLTTCLTFAIPDFEDLRWGFTIDAIKGFYPEVQNDFTTNVDVTKYNHYPKGDDIGKVVFYLMDNQLYKIVTVFYPTNVNLSYVEGLFKGYSEKWGEPNSTAFKEEYNDFSIRGNEHTWIVGSTYISFIGQDYFDLDNKLTDSKLMVEYGLIDPTKRKKDSSLNKLILDKK